VKRNRGERAVLNCSPYKSELKSADERLKARRGRKSLPFAKDMETKYGRKQKMTFSKCFINYKEEVEKQNKYYYYYYCC
jgi:hypothetical protein